MSRFNTGNAIGSADPRDRSDNTKNLDELVNSESKLNHPDRRGNSRKTWHGMEEEFEAAQNERAAEFANDQDDRESVFTASQQDKLDRFNAFIAASGYTGTGENGAVEDYVAGIEFTEYNQIVRDAGTGEFWKISGTVTLPYATSGAGLPEGTALEFVGDTLLRQELQSSLSGNTGSALVGHNISAPGSSARTVAEKLKDVATINDFGADPSLPLSFSTALDNYEGFVSDSSLIDLQGGAYQANEFPNSSAFHNGGIVKGGFTRQQILPASPLVSVNSSYEFGGQLKALKRRLSDPFTQFMGIVFIGDSITWGTGTGENNAFGDRDRTLSDNRDHAETGNLVNLVREYIGEQYFDSSSLVLSNWPASSSGQSTGEYSRELYLYPGSKGFTVNDSSPTAATVTEANIEASLTLRQLRLRPVNTGSFIEVSFTFTGSELTVSFGGIPGGTPYELFVAGVSQGSFSTSSDDAGITLASDNRRTHTFGFIKNATVKLRVQEANAGAAFYLEAIIIPKKVRVINNGIPGQRADLYKTSTIDNSTDGLPVQADDLFCFIQFGANDRTGQVTISPGGQNAFYDNLKALVDALPAACDKIMMVSNPADEDMSIRTFTMQDARATVYQFSEDESYDFIDNFNIYRGLSKDVYTSDGLHPNKLGYALMAQNVINALESS